MAWSVACTETPRTVATYSDIPIHFGLWLSQALAHEMTAVLSKEQLLYGGLPVNYKGNQLWSAQLSAHNKSNMLLKKRRGKRRCENCSKITIKGQY